MKLHENKNLFQDAIAATATLKGLREIHIEKNYWVTLALVANDDVIALKTGIAWLSNHPATAILFSDTVNTWNQIQETYNSEFRAFVYGKLPSNNDILETLQKVSNRLKDIKWTI